LPRGMHGISSFVLVGSGECMMMMEVFEGEQIVCNFYYCL
jgi:hypothetical protein